ncbi:glycosyltransferase [Candidatus Woesearchaeota archaeon]|nr:glycosyltransferase [Candidatus Woesearchaeota archaeon]
MHNKKILLTTSFYPPFHLGGDAMHVHYLAKLLSRVGFEVHVLFSLDSYRLKKKIKKSQKINKIEGVKYHILKSRLGRLEPVLNYCLGSQSHTLKYYKKLVSKEKFDIIHHHNISLLGHDILNKINNEIILYTAHDYWLICHKYNFMKKHKLCMQKSCFTCCIIHKKPYQFFRHSKKFKRNINNIDCIICPSEFMKVKIQPYFKNVKKILNFVPNPTGLAGKNKKRDFFLYAGKLEKCKGILELIKVFSQSNEKLVIIGDGKLRKSVKKASYINRNIEFMGWKNTDKVLNFMQGANALILPSICLENMSVSALEAISTGTPVIGAEIGGIPEIVSKVDKDLLFDHRNFNELKHILLDFKKKKYKSEKIKSIFKKYFSEKYYLNEYNDLLEEINSGKT